MKTIQLHWQLDVAFREDDSRAKKDNSLLNLNILCKETLRLLNQADFGKRGAWASARKSSSAAKNAGTPAPSPRPTDGLSSTARTAHLLCSPWGFALMCLHLGLHMDAMLKKKPKWFGAAAGAVSL